MSRRNVPGLLSCLFISLAAARIEAQAHTLHNESISADFGPTGLTALHELGSDRKLPSFEDAWTLEIDNDVLRSKDVSPSVHATNTQIAYDYVIAGYEIEATYQLKPGWRFVSKQLSVLRSPRPAYTVRGVTSVDLALADAPKDLRVPTSYTPQMGSTIEATQRTMSARDFGLFLRFGGNQGLMLLVQNPFLETKHNGRQAALRYAPEIAWNQEWEPFRSDLACLGPYRLAGESIPREMLLEWKLASAEPKADGLDRGEIQAFMECVRAFLIHPSPSPTSVEAAWTLNDYQIDVGTDQGKQEYKRIIDTTSDLGIKTLLYAPTNNSLAKRDDDTDTWHWEHTLWLNLGQKIRKGEWDPASSPLPSDVTSMLAYAKSRNVGLLAYVYPSVPFTQSPSWLVKGSGSYDPGSLYASLSSRPLQDLLLHDLIAFRRRTGIAGYSFDYAFLNLGGSSSYSQWFGWRRVMEELRKAEPDIVIDGRQSYQLYGPWSWLAGSYPHPTGNDEQPESFLPYPDLHFDRVSADRTRFVNFWYRNYQFAPAELVPGYATHQTERSRNIPDDVVAAGKPPGAEEVHTAFRQRDWDYLGFRYSFLSSIGTAGWNNVVDMIPARDLEEYRNFSTADKQWIRSWLEWTDTNKELLRNTRTILNQPQMGKLDGTAAFLGNHGYLFLFNPNYKALGDELHLNETIGLKSGTDFVLRELYPARGRIWGKPGSGTWRFGDSVHLHLDGTSATVLEVVPAATEMLRGHVFNAAALDRNAPGFKIKGTTLAITDAAGEPGTEVELGVLLSGEQVVRSVTVNGQQTAFERHGAYVAIPVRFAGERFRQAQQVTLKEDANGTLQGSFTIPQRVMEQLQDRARAWPIPWTKDDLNTTWLAPERLLLYVQAAEAQDTMNATGTLDGKKIVLKPAYTSVRVHPADFVGLYADISTVRPGTAHTLSLHLEGVNRAKLQGVFFENVEPQLTTSIVGAH